MESSKKFKVGDFVQAYKKFCGYITWIDHKNESADVEWDEVDVLDETDRGEGGFGSTGR